jgi:elongation factor Ts
MFSLCRHARRPFLSPLRFYSTQPEKPSIKLVAELRKRTEVSITKAREALTATSNNVTAALDWLQNDLITSGAKKAAKVEGRDAKEGLISVSVLSGGAGSRMELGDGGVRAAMIELNCETDFVGRNELFGKLAADIAHTAAFLTEPIDSARLPECWPLHMDQLNDAPLLSHSEPQLSPSSTVGSAIRDTIAKLGEKILLRRAVALVQNPEDRDDRRVRIASYLHGSVKNPANGRIGALVSLMVNSPRLSTLWSSGMFRKDLERLERSLARQVVGFETHSIMDMNFDEDRKRDPHVLYDQPFAMYSGNDAGVVVEDVLQQWAVERGLVNLKDDLTQITDASALIVTGFEKWTVGEEFVEVDSKDTCKSNIPIIDSFVSNFSNQNALITTPSDCISPLTSYVTYALDNRVYFVRTLDCIKTFIHH